MDCSWNHEYFGSLAKLALIYFAKDPIVLPSIHDSMNIPKIEFIS